MANIEIFKDNRFGEVRVAGTSEQPLFCLADVCKILSLDSSQVIKRLEDGVVAIHPITDSLGREQNANFVTEDGFYDVVLDSRKPQAREFRKWVTSEVLPSIRKTGSYSTAAFHIKQLEVLSAKQEETAEMLERKIVCTQNAQYELNKIVNDMKEAVCFTRNKVDYIWRNFDKLLNPNRPSHPAGKPVRRPQDFDSRMAGLSDPEILEIQHGFVLGIPDFARRLRYVLHRQVSSSEVEDWLYWHGYLSMDSERFGMPDGIAKENDYLVSTGRMWQGLCASFITKEGEKYFTELIANKGGLK